MTHNNHKTMNTIFKHALGVAFTFAALLAFSACMGGGHAMQSGGEVTGVRAASFTEPAPYGMVEVKRGYLKAGLQDNDSLWGVYAPQKDISVDGFWMDQTEVTNSMYRQFVEWVRDSIIRERLARLSKSQKIAMANQSHRISTGRSPSPGVSRRKTKNRLSRVSM